MNVVIMLLETNCLSLSLARNWSAPRRRYRCAVVASPDAGQGLARRKRRKEGSLCQRLSLVPSSPVPGPETTLQPREQGRLSPGPGSSPTQVVPMHGLPSGLRSITLVAGSWVWGSWLPPRQTEELPARPLSCVWGKKEAAGLTCVPPGRDAGRALLCCFPGITPASSPCIPCSPPYPSRTRALKLEMVVWKLCANTQIISLYRWHEMPHTERIKAWQLQKWGKRKGVQRGMLSCLVCLLPSMWASCRGKNTPGWPEKAWYLHLAFHGYLRCVSLMQLNIDALAGIYSHVEMHPCHGCSTCIFFPNLI